MKREVMKMVVFLLVGVVPAWAQTPERPDAGDSPGQDRLLGTESGSDLRTHKVYFGTSPDGLEWTVQEMPIREHASAPDLLELQTDSPMGRKGTLIVTFVEAELKTEDLARIISTDRGETWSEAQPLTLLNTINQEGANGPSLIELPDGRLRLYFLGSEVTAGDTASVPGAHHVYSAVSTDGLTFEVEPGVRFEAIGVSDPEVVAAMKGGYTMYLSRGQETLKAISRDGLTFQAVSDFLIHDGGVPGAVILPDGPTRVYVTGREGIVSYMDRSGQPLVREEGVRMADTHEEAVTDPDVIRRADGAFIGVIRRAPFSSPEPGQGDNPVGQPASQVEAGAIPAPSYFHVIRSASSEDGLTWTQDEGIRLEHASAPSALVRDDGKIALYFIDASGLLQETPAPINCALSSDGIHFETAGCTSGDLPSIEGQDSSVVKVGDKYRMYYQEEQRPPLEGVPPAELYDDTRLINLHLEFPEPDFWEQLNVHIQDEEDIPATLIAEGERYEGIGVRFKGKTSFLGGGFKKPFNLSVDAFVPTQRLWGYKTLNLNNGYVDPTLVREKILYDVFRYYLPASKANFVRLYLNDQYWGLYTNVQQPNKEFIAEWFHDLDGNRYKGDAPGEFRRGTASLTWLGAEPSQYQQGYQLKTQGNDTGWSDLIHMIDVLNNTPADEFEQEIQRVLNVDGALWYIAICNLFVNLDSYLGGGHNYYLYSEFDGYFHMIPWDLNMAFSSNTELSPFFDADNPQRPLVANLLSVLSFRARYLAHYRTLLEEIFHEGYLIPQIQKHQDLIRTSVETDMLKLYSMEAFTRNIAENILVSGGREGNRGDEGGKQPAEGKGDNPRGDEGGSLPEGKGDNLKEDEEDPPPGGTDEILGLLPFVRNRRFYLETVPELNQPAPTVASVTYTPVQPTDQDTVWVQVQVGGERPIHAVALFYAVSGGRFVPVAMQDDGRHRDGGDGDGLFGAAIAPQFSATIRYYILAEDDAGTVQFAPARAEHETFSYTLVQTQVTGQADRIALNEFMASNTQTMTDPQSEYDDWIELHNLTDETIPLGGMYLTDDLDRPQQWSFPDTTLAPRGYLLVWADGDEGDAPGLHAGFRLSADGEQIGLFDTDARGNGVLDMLSFGPQESDVSMGRNPDGTGLFEVLLFSTPGATNRSMITGVLAESAGAQPQRFDLKQNFPNPFNSGTVIRFILPEEATDPMDAELIIYNLAGQKVITLLQGVLQAGEHEVHWDGQDEQGHNLASGVYLYRLQAGKEVETRRLLLLR